MPDQVTLAVAGGEFGGWTTVSVVRGIEQIAGRFELELTERWPGQETPRPIAVGEQCTVAVNGTVVITGYVDDVVPRIDADTNTLRVTGRDATGDLVDCSAALDPGEWTGASLDTIARDLLKPFGIPLTVATDIGGPWTHTFALQSPSETAFEALERAARMRGVLLVADGLGGLALTRAGTERVPLALEEGENVLAGEGFQSLRDRYSEYRVLGQAPGSDLAFGTTVAEISATETDAGVPRYRPLVILAEENASQADAAQRAVWEKNVRVGRAERVSLTVYGWTHPGGVWQPNTLVQVLVPALKARGEFLIAQVELSQTSHDGTLTRLSLARPAAFDVEPLAENAGDGEESLF